MSVALDTEKGGRLAFGELRDPPLAPLSFLTMTVSTQVCKTKWSKRGLSNIRLTSEVNFNPAHLVHFQNQTSKIVEQKGCILTVDPPFKLRCQEMTISQYDAIADPLQLQHHIAEAWNHHWNRDPPPISWEDDWKDIGPVLEHLPDLPTKAFTPLSLDIWGRNCKKLNKRSSRGGCGFSVIEMVAFPDIIVQQLFKIFEACERGMPWPSQWVTAKVCMLSKCDNPKSPFDARPITIFGVLYRQWSRIRSREILQYMASFMPVELAASTNGISADAVACLITHIAETAINRGESICGIGIDLTRCFNTLPRYPIMLALRKLGVPQAYIAAWGSMLDNMTRTLTIGKSQSVPLPSTTGAPEGCGMSVTAMACITFWCGKFVTNKTPIARPICYADNWNILAKLPHDLLYAVKNIEEFVNQLRLSINPKKSWLWSTRPSHRKALKGTQIGHDVLPVVCNTSDLGCDLQYANKLCKPLGKKRWAKASRVCGKIAKSKAPKGFKRRLTKGAGISAASFGLNLQYTPKTQWKVLRTAISRALGCCGAGASPWLSLAAVCLDPQLEGLISICRFWRRFLHSFPSQVVAFEHNIMHGMASKIGPVANLRNTLVSVGWSFVDPDTLEHSQSKTQIKWRDCSNRHLAYFFQKCWPWTVAAKSPHRKDWDRTIFDIPMNLRAVRKRTPHQAAVIQGFASGKHFTNDIIHKYDKTVQPTCPFCTCNDSKHHRIFSCKEFQEIRGKFSKVVQWASRQPGSLKYFGLPKVQPTIWEKIRSLCPSKPSWTYPQPNDEPWYLFLDGSAFGQTQKDLVISSWAGGCESTI